MLKSSGRRYSSSSESQADAWEVDVGEDEDEPGEKDDSSRSSRWSSDPIFNFGTRCDF
jgi:hypothetical protein